MRVRSKHTRRSHLQATREGGRGSTLPQKPPNGKTEDPTDPADPSRLQALLSASEATLRGEIVPPWTVGALPAWPYWSATLKEASLDEADSDVFLLRPFEGVFRLLKGPWDSWTREVTSPICAENDNLLRLVERFGTPKEDPASREAVLHVYEYALREAWVWLIRLSTQRVGEMAITSPGLRAAACHGIRAEMKRLVDDLRQLLAEYPCPGCGRTRWCSRSDDGRVDLCHAAEKPGNDWAEGIDQKGSGYWWRRRAWSDTIRAGPAW